MAAVSNIIAAGFGSWSSVEYVPTMGFGIGVGYTVVVHYHTLEGPSQELRKLTGPPKVLHSLEGPSQRLRILKGSN